MTRLREQADRGRAVLVSSHVLAEVAQTVDDVVVIADGQLRAHGTLEQVLGGDAIGDWSMVWLRDHDPSALSSQHTCCGAFRVGRQRWGQCERMELYELRHASASLLMERGLPPHSVANQLGHTDGGALVQRVYGHFPARALRDRIGLAFGSWGAEEEQAHRDVPANGRVS